jgi:hypothetical protein
VVLLSLAFLGVFGGFQAAQGLQTSLNATLGGVNLSCLYGTFSLLCLVAPPLLAAIERALGIRLLMLVCALAYVAMVVSNVIDASGDPSPIWAVPISMNVLVGMAAPLLWTSQNDYVSRCAWFAARDAAQRDASSSSGGAPASLAALESEMTTQFNSLFFSIYMVSGAGGNILASSIMEALQAGKATKRVLFITLGAMSAVGAFLFLLLPPVPPAGSSERPASVFDTARLALTDKRTSLLIPLMVTNGMTLASFFGDFQTDITCPVAGQSLVGFLLAAFYAVNSLANACWGRALSRRLISRRVAYAASTIFIAGYLVVKLLWTAPHNFEKDNDGGEWAKRDNPHTWDVVVVFTLAALFACGDAFWESGPPATLQTFYAGTEQVVPAMANYKLWQSVGMFVQFPIGVALADRPEIRAIVLLVSVAVSFLCLLRLDLDPSASASA